jgi:hypothetical protein
MSTRGTIAVTIDGETKGSYNHSDSYPTWLGNRVLEFIRGMDLEDTRRKARALKPVPDREPTEEDIFRLAPYTDLGVSTGSTKEWYCVLRLTQGDLCRILDAGLYEPFPVGDDEYSYVVDLDTERLAIYRHSEKIVDLPFAELPKEFTEEDAKPARRVWEVAQ